MKSFYNKLVFSLASYHNVSGDVKLDVNVQDKDMIFRGNDGGASVTALTLDMSDAGTAVFNHDIRIANDGQIGSASDKDAIAISSGGVVTMNQIPVLSAGLNVSGGTIAGTVATATQNSITTMTGLTTTGALNAGSITSGFGAIDNGTSNIRSATITLDTDADADDNTADSSSGRLTIGAGGDLNLYHGGTNSYIVNSTGSLYIHSETDDSDIVFTGEDGSSGITALTLDMSAAGKAQFNASIRLITDGNALQFGADQDVTLTHVDMIQDYY